MSVTRWRGNREDTPAARWEDAFLTGNGRHGAMVHGDPADERLIVNHHLLVRPNGAEHARAPHLAPGLGRMREDILAGRAAEAVRRTTEGLALQWVRPFHPAFALRVRRAGAEVTGYRRETDYRTGVVTSVWSEDSGQWRAETFVSRADDVIVHRLTAPPNGAITAEILLDHRLEAAPDNLRVMNTTTDDLLRIDVRYPDAEGLGYTGHTVVRADGGTTKASGMSVLVRDCAELTLTTRIEPWPVADGGGAPDAAPYEASLERHLALHRTAYDRVSLDLGASEEERALPASTLLAGPGRHRPALLERLFDAGRYHLLSSSGMLPPRLTGVWTGSWDTAWSGAFTCDANLNLQISSAAVAALPEVSLAHAALVVSQLPDWRDNARRLHGARGIVAPAHTDGLSGRAYHFSDDYPLHLWTAGADWLLHPLLDHVAVTGDEEFHRGTLLPMLDEVASFYEDFLTTTDGDDLVIVPSYSPENTPAGADSPVTVNAAMDIAAARHALLATGRADHADLADRLPPYHVNADGALAEWSWPAAPDAYDHRHISHLYPVWPLDEITPLDTPRLARAAHRALETRGSENDSAHGYLHTALVAARLGDAARVELPLEAVLGGDFFHASLMSAHYPARDVYNADAAHTLPTVLIEALVHSAPTGRIVLLPALPGSLPTGTLRGVRTRCRVTVAELTWDTAARTLRAVLRPDTTRTVTVHVGADGTPVHVLLPAGRDTALDLTIPPPTEGDAPADEPRESP